MPRRRIAVDAERFLGIDDLQRIHPQLQVDLTDHSYLPKVEDPRSDWVASVAVPAFLALRHALAREGRDVRGFCSIGTGSGLDAIAAAEILAPDLIGLTDLHADVVDAAAGNLRRNLLAPERLRIVAGTGDLLHPLLGQDVEFDVIYENLPNIPLATGASLQVRQTSATFVAPRREPLPGVVTDNLLALHYLALRQARHFLGAGGTVLSSIGVRVPVRDILVTAEVAGFVPEILTCTWKVQSEPEEVIGGYAVHQGRGLGPFFFYPVPVLEHAFAGLSPAEAGARIHALEERLAPHRLDAHAAQAAHFRGARLGHPVVVVRSRLPS
ncbi:class I SAM-dependent methyltransferase [Rhodovastum atsumiense]|uniref:Class I SAM-dependent methyltransferase n=1 Tax=Rhodovastum atsumiense TaxID=504468 RepID=A0A5M6IWU0_9PROT|nr:class I SAM-dependent methyltransferase [Rhodovastum atsumiense]